jgi:copper resistance protein C
VAQSGGRAERRGSLVPLALVLGLMVAGILLLPTSADAHTELVEATPAPGATVRGPVDGVRLVFAEPVVADLTVVAVTTGAVALDVGRPVVSGTGVEVTVGLPQPPGSYVVAYRTVSSDGHLVTGSFTFGLQRPAAVPDHQAGAPAPGNLATPTTAVPRSFSADEPAASRVAPSAAGARVGQLLVWVGVGVLLGVTLLRRRLLLNRRE